MLMLPQSLCGLAMNSRHVSVLHFHIAIPAKQLIGALLSSKLKAEETNLTI